MTLRRTDMGEGMTRWEATDPKHDLRAIVLTTDPRPYTADVVTDGRLVTLRLVNADGMPMGFSYRLLW